MKKGTESFEEHPQNLIFVTERQNLPAVKAAMIDDSFHFTLTLTLPDCSFYPSLTDRVSLDFSSIPGTYMVEGENPDHELSSDMSKHAHKILKDYI